jgi:hypothetical protein
LCGASVLGEATVLIRATVLEMMIFVGATVLKATVLVEASVIVGATVLERMCIGATVLRGRPRKYGCHGFTQ